MSGDCINIVEKIPAGTRALLERVGRLAQQRRVEAHAVGGCVRDWCLGLRRLTDVDVTVRSDGIAFARALAADLGGEVESHGQFGTATIRGIGRAGHRLDVATCRRETYRRPAAYPSVQPGTLQDDLARRDFTVNAMAAALHPECFGGLVDPFGGRADLRARCLRILHPKSFVDDPSRILRGVRFSVRFGLRWEPATARALRQAVAQGALGWLNAGRLEKELLRMLEEPDPRACLRALADVLSGSW